MGENTLEIGSLNREVAYYFTIDTYNENGITRTSQIMSVQKNAEQNLNRL